MRYAVIRAANSFENIELFPGGGSLNFVKEGEKAVDGIEMMTNSKIRRKLRSYSRRCLSARGHNDRDAHCTLWPWPRCRYQWCPGLKLRDHCHRKIQTSTYISPLRQSLGTTEYAVRGTIDKLIATVYVCLLNFSIPSLPTLRNTSMSTSLTDNYDPTKLSHLEVFWRDHQPWLQKQGYMLRPRYRTGWKPSWVAQGKNNYWMYEDSLTHAVSYHFFLSSSSLMLDSFNPISTTVRGSPMAIKSSSKSYGHPSIPMKPISGRSSLANPWRPILRTTVFPSTMFLPSPTWMIA